MLPPGLDPRRRPGRGAKKWVISDVELDSVRVSEGKQGRKVREGLEWIVASWKWYLASAAVLDGYTASSLSFVRGVNQGSLDPKNVWHA